MSQDVQLTPAANRALQQRQLDKWKQEFNHVRPHQALGGRTPAEVYKSMPACAPPKLPEGYPFGFRQVRVFRNGSFRFARNSYFLSAALAGFTVGLEPLNALHVRVWFYAVDLGLLEIEPQVDDTIYVNADSRVAGESTLKRTT